MRWPWPGDYPVGAECVWPPFRRPFFRRYWFFCSRCRCRCRCIEIRGIDIVLTGNSHQREEGIAPGIGQRRSHPMRRRRLADRADWPVRGDPFPDACARTVVRLMMPAPGRRCRLHGRAISCWLKDLAHDVEPARQWRVAEGLFLPAWFPS